MPGKTESLSQPQITFEFLRRVVNELNGRRFEYVDEPRESTLSASVKIDDLFYTLPEVTRNFAARINPELKRCFKVATAPNLGRWATAHDPISGATVRSIRIWDPIRSELIYRFDAAFS